MINVNNCEVEIISIAVHPTDDLISDSIEG